MREAKGPENVKVIHHIIDIEAINHDNIVGNHDNIVGLYIAPNTAAQATTVTIISDMHHLTENSSPKSVISVPLARNHNARLVCADTRD